MLYVHIALVFLFSILRGKSIYSCNIQYIIFNLQQLIVNNLRQIGEKQCTPIIPLIKQDTLKRNNNLFILKVLSKLFCWFLSESA